MLNLGLSGNIDRVVDILTDGGDLWVEALQRAGVGTPTAHIVERLISFATPVQRFWLYDCLIFLNYEEELRLDRDQLWRDYQESYEAAQDQVLDLDDEDAVDAEMLREASYLTKAMRRAKDERDAGTLDVLWVQVQKLQRRTRSLNRQAILNSEYGCCLYELGDYETAWAIALSNVSFYLMQIQLRDDEFWGVPPEVLLGMLQQSEVGIAVLSRLGDALILLGMCLRELGEWPAKVFEMAKFLFGIIGGQKAFYKAELHMARQLGRLKENITSAIKLMETRLTDFKRIGFNGGLVATTCTLAALHEASGNNQRAEALLSELAHFDPEDVREEIADARSQVAPYTAPSWGWRTLAAMGRAE